MIKKITVGILLLSFVFCAACSSKTLPDTVSCEQILNTATAVQSYDNVKIYVKGKTEIDTYSMSVWADGSFKECEEYDLLSDYAICYSNDNNTYEISILQSKNVSDAEKLASLLERRKQTLSQGDKAEYDPNFKKLMSDSQIITDGRLVMLLITENNNDVVNAIEQLK